MTLGHVALDLDGPGNNVEERDFCYRGTKMTGRRFHKGSWKADFPLWSESAVLSAVGKSVVGLFWGQECVTATAVWGCGMRSPE